MLCQDCSKKSTCTKLCPEAEEYVNQDRTSQKHFVPPSKPIQGTAPLKIITKSRDELILLAYFVDRKTQREIADMFYISQPMVHKIIKKYKEIIAENIRKAVISRS